MPMHGKDMQDTEAAERCGSAALRCISREEGNRPCSEQVGSRRKITVLSAGEGFVEEAGFQELLE